MLINDRIMIENLQEIRYPELRKLINLLTEYNETCKAVNLISSKKLTVKYQLHGDEFYITNENNEILKLNKKALPYKIEQEHTLPISKLTFFTSEILEMTLLTISKSYDITDPKDIEYIINVHAEVDRKNNLK